MVPEHLEDAGVCSNSARYAASMAPDPRMLYAALDLGTNCCRMLIARPTGNGFQVVDSFSKSVRLGAGLGATGYLSHASMSRTVRALSICRDKLQNNRVTRMRLVATEACRRARNGHEFIRRIRTDTGLELEIIAPEEEARLAVISCASLISTRTEQLLIVDIGGGSTELVWIDVLPVPQQERRDAIMHLPVGLGRSCGDSRDLRVVDWISVPLGVSTLRDQFDDVSDDIARFALMSWHFEEQLTGFAPYRDLPAGKGFQMIGTSGTITTLAATHLGLHRYDRSKVDGLRLTSQQVDTVVRHLLSLGPSGRRRAPLLNRNRHALIMPGAAILQALLRSWPTDRLSVADRGLREGLLFSQMSADGAVHNHRD